MTDHIFEIRGAGIINEERKTRYPDMITITLDKREALDIIQGLVAFLKDSQSERYFMQFLGKITEDQ